jgi:ubiquinol-cytochrome c reductase iron-sulfur subunit
LATEADTHSASDGTRRDFLYVAAGAVGTVGVVLGGIWPLINQLNPDASVLALSTVDFDLSSLEEGQSVTIKWRGQPIFVTHRTQKQIDEAKAVSLAELRDPETDAARTKTGHEQYLVQIGICTHLGCIPHGPGEGEFDGWFCPCHGSQYDSAGRIRKGPAPRNLVIPPYRFTSDTAITIG